MTQFKEVQRGLEGVLDLLDAELSHSERAEVEHFIEVAEYGIALETLCDILREKGKSISSQTLEKIAHVGTLMNMGPEVWGAIPTR